MRSTLLIFLFVFLSAGAFAQTVKGKLTDSKSEALIGATVFVEGTKSGAQTDVNGEYIISGLKPGKYRLRFQYIGMNTDFKNIELAAGQTLVLNVTMQEDGKRL